MKKTVNIAKGGMLKPAEVELRALRLFKLSPFACMKRFAKRAGGDFYKSANLCVSGNEVLVDEKDIQHTLNFVLIHHRRIFYENLFDSRFLKCCKGEFHKFISYLR